MGKLGSCFSTVRSLSVTDSTYRFGTLWERNLNAWRLPTLSIKVGAEQWELERPLTNELELLAVKIWNGMHVGKDGSFGPNSIKLGNLSHPFV